MSFICKNTDCSAPENKKGKVYPSAMECPFCDSPLVEVFSFNETDLKLINNLPYVIAYPLKRAIAEKHAWTKINLLKDTFLNYLKYLGLITASEFFNSALKEKKMVALFQQALAEPSFGSWNQYIRKTLNYLKENNHKFFCPDLLDYYELVEAGDRHKLFKGEIEFIDSNGDVQLKKQEATAINMLINFRNRYLGHGLTLDESASKKLWDEYYPIFSLLLKQLNFANIYPMFKHEHGESYLLQSAELSTIEKGTQDSARVWIENPDGQGMNILPFFVVPGELSLTKEDKEQILAYESYTGKTIKFFSPEGTEKQTSGKILEKLNLLLRDKQKEQPFTPDSFTKEVFLSRIADENKLTLDTLTAEKKYIPGVYVHRQEMEIKLREWIGARANIFFLAAEAGSGKTNLLIELQKQYAAQNLSVLFIRASRMEKSSLQAQIAYLLNIQPELGLEHYPSLAGTQANPTFIFIDGLNEAEQAASLWQEVIDISKKCIPGSLKFVISSRANTSGDLNSFTLTESDEVYLYGEKKEGHTGLSAYAFWLTALNMAEMKSAWEAYVQTNKNKYKPQFSFDDLATFDRGIYNLIGNPLVLRIFLETYHNKPLPKKGNKHLNIWQDWLSTFSDPELDFLKLLAQAVWNKGENELLLDDLLHHSDLKPYLTTDLINAPYPRLKNLGWISRYVKELNVCLSFTVEGSLLFLMGSQLNEQGVNKDYDTITSLLKTGTKVQRAAIEVYLSQLALAGDLSLVCELIDTSEEYHYACNSAMLIFLRSYGVKLFIEKVFSEPSDNDWLAMLMLNKTLDDLQDQVLRKLLLEELMPFNTFRTKAALELGLKACSILNIGQAQEYLSEIDRQTDLFFDDEKILENYGDVYRKFAQHDKSLEFYQKCLDVQVKTLGAEHPSVATSYNNIGIEWNYKGEYEKALDFHQKCLDIQLKTLGAEHSDVATSFFNIGSILYRNGEYENALDFYQKSLDIRIKSLGAWHPDVADSYNNIGMVWNNKGEYEKALDFYQKCLDIDIKTLGAEHPDVATSYENIGLVWDNKGEYAKALDFYQKCLDIQLKTLGTEHPFLAFTYNNIGVVWVNQGEYAKALDFYQKSLDIRIKSLGLEHPDVATTYSNIGLLWKNKGEYAKALDFFQKSLDIDLKTFGAEHPDVAISYNNIGLVWDNKGEYAKALDFYQKCLDIQLNTLGAKHPDLATTYSNIGLVWNYKGEYTKALDFFQKSLDIRLKTLGAEHPDLATSYGNIGLVWDNKGEYGKALDFYQKCLDIQLKTLGSEHPNVATSYNNIGWVLESKGEYAKALDFYQKCLDIQLKTLGTEHPDVATSYNDIGLVWDNEGEYAKALDFYQKSLDIRFKTFGAEHPAVATSYNNIGVVWENQGEYSKALDFYQKGLDIRLKSLGRDHHSVATSYNNIGLVWKNKGEYAKALNFFQKCLDIVLKTFGAQHPDVAISYNNIGLVWDNKGEYAKALDFYQKCLDIQLNTLGAEHPNVATSYNNIGSVWESKGEYAKALDFYQKCLDIQIKTLGSEHPDVATSYNDIGLVWDNEGEYAKALDFYQKSLDIRFKTFGAEHPAVATSYNNIGVVWENQGEYSKALDFYQKGLDIRLKSLGAEHPAVANSYINIGIGYQKMESFEKAIEAFKNGLSIEKKGGYRFRIASCYEKLNNLNDAFNYFLQSAEIRNAHSEVGPNHESTTESIQNTVRVAKLIGKENELPEWIKNHIQ